MLLSEAHIYQHKGNYQYGESEMGKTDDEILTILSTSEPLTLVEIAEKLGKKPKVVFRSLRKLFEKEKIECDNKTHRYKYVRS